MLNFSMLKHPLNWLTIVLMLLIAAMVGTLVLQGLGMQPATASS